MTPRLRPGQDTWTYRVYTRDDIDALAGADSEELHAEAPEKTGSAGVELLLMWWARPIAAFRLRIVMNQAFRHLKEPGRMEFVREVVERARAAGVTALVDFPEPVHRERWFVDERHRVAVKSVLSERTGLDECLSGIGLAQNHRERQGAVEGPMAFEGIFDVTRLDWSYAA
jgi:hypothetical protein